MSEPESSPPLTVTSSRQFPDWLKEQNASLAFTTYQAGKLFLIGTNADGRLSIFERTLPRVMGLHADRETLWVASLYQLWRFDNVLDGPDRYQDYDALFVPRLGHVTGDLDMHDVAVATDGTPLFVNTLFSCLATVDEQASFTPLWRPPFISRLAAEDRCHLNGLALRDGSPRYMTAVARTDIAEGWREHRTQGGVVLDVATDTVLADGLSMPHSPRWYRDRLWIIQAGTGDFGFIDTDTGAFEPLCFCPGFARGLAFLGDYAVIGLSLPRENRTFTGLTLDTRLAEQGVGPRCGLLVVDLRSGDLVHSLTIEGVVQELYDVAAVPGVTRPAAIGFQSDEIRRVIKVGAERPLQPAAAP